MATSSGKNEERSEKSAKDQPGTGLSSPLGWVIGEPFHALRAEMDRVFDNFLTTPGRLAESAWEPFRSSALGWSSAPSVDVKETDKGFEINAELPGLDEKDVEITLTDTTLTLKGEKQSSRAEKKENYHLSERRFGSFQRSFQLPENVNRDKVAAKFEKGVLTVTLPKTAKAKKAQRKIGIKSK